MRLALATDQTRARELFAQAQRLHAEGDHRAGFKAAQQALVLDAELIEAMEFLGTALVARQHKFREGLNFFDRAVDLRPDNAGLWYARGWCYEFAAHESRRHPAAEGLEPRPLYDEAARSFRRCLSLKPDGKLVGDAEDLLDHVENELERL